MVERWMKMRVKFTMFTRRNLTQVPYSWPCLFFFPPYYYTLQLQSWLNGFLIASTLTWAVTPRHRSLHADDPWHRAKWRNSTFLKSSRHWKCLSVIGLRSKWSHLLMKQWYIIFSERKRHGFECWRVSHRSQQPRLNRITTLSAII